MLKGIDTNGHAHRPMSEEYLANIQYVDQGIKEMYELFEEYFNHDNSTAYIMTSDHGMTNWGSHGAGHAHETLTPLVAWGAGLQKPEMVEAHEYKDGLSELWGLSGVKRCDVSQADIAPLMTSLIGKLDCFFFEFSSLIGILITFSCTWELNFEAHEVEC